MTAETALIVATGTILGTILGASLGALLTYRLQRKMLTTARTHQLEDLITTRTHQIEDRIAADTARARDLALDAYIDAREGIGWLYGIKIGDIVEHWARHFSPVKLAADDGDANQERIRDARRNLDRASAILGPTPLGQAARDTANGLIALDNALTDGRTAVGIAFIAPKASWTELLGRRRHFPTTDVFEALDRIEAACSHLSGPPDPATGHHPTPFGHTDDSLLGRLRTEISNATKAAESAAESNPAPNA